MTNRATAIVALVTALTVSAAAHAAEFPPHRAFYKLALLPGGPSESGITDVQGLMSFEWADSCDGWTVEQRYVMRFMRADGSDVEIDTTYVTWESKDGLNYRFNMKRKTNGIETERVSGRARLESKGGPGMARFDEPTADRIALSAGTLFPTEHTIVILEDAKAGKRFNRRLVFDGGSVEGAAPVTTIFLGERPPDADSVLTEPLGPHPVRSMRISFFSAESAASSGEELPDSEMSIDVQDNGVLTALTMEFDGLKIAGTLEKIEPLQMPEC